MIKTVKLKKIYPNSQLFLKAHEDDACFDIYAHLGAECIKDIDFIEIESGKTEVIGTGIKMSIPVGYEGVVRPRSGFSLKTTLRIANTPGTIDSGYRDEVKIIMTNIGDNVELVYHENRIAQIGFRKIPDIEVIEVFKDVDLGDTERGKKGFGSSGK